MASNMKYCHLCKAMAFVKTQLSSVVTLDCGHMARVNGDDSKESYEATKGTRTVQATRVETRRPTNAQPRPVQPARVVAQNQPAAKAEPVSPPRPQRRTTNIAATLTDLIDGLGDKSRTS